MRHPGFGGARPRPAMQVRIGKPQRHRNGYRCMLSAVGTGYRAWGPFCTTSEAARDAAETAARRAEGTTRTVGEAIREYLADGAARGLRKGTLATLSLRLQRFLPGDLELEAVSRSHLELRVRELREGRAADTMRGLVADARGFFAWCVERHWLRTNPCEGIKLAGRRRHGKPQLRRDEARALWRLALELAGQGDDGALGVLLALGCALRASEIVTRTVRDIDDHGKLLWVDDVDEWQPKTAAGRRAVEIPEELRPLIAARCRRKLPSAPLFSSSRGVRHHRTWVTRQTRRLCGLAALPSVCAHSLRGLHATLAIQEGLSPRIVAATLGHESPAVTLASYAEAGSVERSRRRAAVEVLRGGKK